MMAQRGFYTLCLLIMGIGWGATIPLTKVAVSEGYQEFGLIFWQQIICAFVLGIVLCIRRQGAGLGSPQIFAHIIIAVFGTVLPNTASYEAAVHLRAIMSPNGESVDWIRFRRFLARPWWAA